MQVVCLKLYPRVATPEFKKFSIAFLQHITASMGSFRSIMLSLSLALHP